MNQTVWLTGAGGFTGQYLITLLQQQGYHVISPEIDITDNAAVAQSLQQISPDYILHLAAISHVLGDVEKIYRVNTVAAHHILAAAAELVSPPKRVIMASSANIYGQQDIPIISETLPPQPLNHYGCSKLSMEYLAKTFKPALDIIITRPFNYTGRGQSDSFLIPKIVEHFKQRKAEIKLGNIDIWRDFSDVRWICQAYVGLLSAKACYDTVNLCSQRLISIESILTTLKTLTDHDINVIQDTALMRKTDIRQQCGDNSRLMEMVPELGQPAPFEHTLQWML